MELMCSICAQELDIYTRWPRLIPNTGDTICQCCVQQIVDGSMNEDRISHIQSDLEQVPFSRNQLQHLKNNPLKIDDFPLNQSLLRILQLQKTKKSGSLNSVNQTFEEWTTEEHSLDSHTFLDALSQASSIKKQKKTTTSRCSPEQDDSFASLNYSYNSSNTNPKLCSVHRRQLEVVCLQCKTMICTNCALFGAHKSHEMQSEENMISILEMKGAELIEIVEKIHSESESVSMQKYDQQFRTSIIQKQTTIINKIVGQFADLRKQLDTKEKSIIEAVNYIFDRQIQSWNDWWHNNQFYNQCQLWLNQAQTTFNKFTDQSNRYWDLLEMTEGLQKRGTQLQNDIKKNITFILTKKESIIQEQLTLRFNPVNIDSFCCVNPQSQQQEMEETDLLDNISPSPSFNCSQFNDSPFGKQSQPLQQITPQQNTNFMRNMRSITPKQIENQEPSSPLLKTSRKRSAVPMKIQMQLDELRKGKGDVAEFNIDLSGEILQTVCNEMKYWKVKTVKLLKCNLTDESLSSILRMLPACVISLNVSQNQLTDKSVDAILIQGQLSLKNIVLSQNKINARNVKNKVMDLKKAGLSITL